MHAWGLRHGCAMVMSDNGMHAMQHVLLCNALKPQQSYAPHQCMLASCGVEART